MPMPISGDEMEQFVRAEGERLKSFESRYGVKKREVVNELIERSCCGEEVLLRPFIGGHGSEEMRLAAVLAVLDSFKPQADEVLP